MNGSASTSSSRSHSPQSWEVEEADDDSASLLPLPLDLPSLSTAAFPASRPTELFKYDLDLPLKPARWLSVASQRVDSYGIETNTINKSLRSMRSPIIKSRSTRSKRPEIIVSAAESTCSINPSICSPVIEEDQAGPVPRTMLDQFHVYPVPLERMSDQNAKAYDGEGRVDDTGTKADDLDGIPEGVDERAEGRDGTENDGYGRATGHYRRASEGYPEECLQAYDEMAPRHDRSQSSWSQQPNKQPAKGLGWRQVRSRESASESSAISNHE